MEWDYFLSLSPETIKKKVCLFGAGYNGSFWGFHLVKDLGFNIDCYIDNYKTGYCNELPIHDFTWLKGKLDEYYVFVTTEGDSGREICDAMEKEGDIEYFWLCESGNGWLSDLGEYIIALNEETVLEKFKYFVDDKLYLTQRFRYRMGYTPDLDNPKTFNEKINWLKIHNRNPEYTEMVDKYTVKSYITKKLGKEYIVPLIGVWDSFDDIDVNALPDKFVLKCTHDSGSVIICKDKSNFDFEKAKFKLENRLKLNYFWPEREWAYKNIRRRIIAEEFIDDGNDTLVAYKVFNFMGKPEIIQVIQNDKTENESIDYFDNDWNLLELRQNFPNSKIHLDKPVIFDEMMNISALLSQNIPFVRTDFYIVKEKLLFSEFTFYTDSGSERFYPDKWDYYLGKLIAIGENK